MCNNSPIKLISSENVRHWSVGPIPSHRLQKKKICWAIRLNEKEGHRGGEKAKDAGQGGAATGADLGGSSKYSKKALKAEVENGSM